MQFLAGKKTILCAIICAIIGADHALIAYPVAWFVAHPIPDWVTFLLGAAGLYSVRSAITTSTAQTTAAILAQIDPYPVASATQTGTATGYKIPVEHVDPGPSQDQMKADPSPDNLTFVRTNR